MKKWVEVKGTRQQRVENVAQIMLSTMLTVMIIWLVYVLLFPDYLFTVTSGNVLMSGVMFMLLRFNFVQLSMFIVDYEYSVNNYFEIEEDISPSQSHKILSQINIFHDIGLDSPLLESIHDFDKISLEPEWVKTFEDKLPTWNGLLFLSKYAIKLTVGKID